MAKKTVKELTSMSAKEFAAYMYSHSDELFSHPKASLTTILDKHRLSLHVVFSHKEDAEKERDQKDKELGQLKPMLVGLLGMECPCDDGDKFANDYQVERWLKSLNVTTLIGRLVRESAQK